MVLRLGAQHIAFCQLVLVFQQRRTRLITGAFFTPAGTFVVAHITPGNAGHKTVSAVAGIHQQGTGDTTVNTAGRQAKASAHAGTVAETRLRRKQIDHSAHGTAAIEYRARPLDHFHPVQQAKVHEGCQRSLRLCRIHADAIHHHHHAFLFQPAQHRVLAPGTIGVQCQARFAAQQVAGRAGAGSLWRNHFNRLRGGKAVTGITAGSNDIGAQTDFIGQRLLTTGGQTGQ